jgi:hypothetical protein
MNPQGFDWRPMLALDDGSGAEARVDIELLSGAREVATFRIVASGRSAGSLRSVAAVIRQRSVADHAWFTDIEAWDQVVTSALQPRCDSYRYALDATTCARPAFGESDRIDGPVHTNDALLLAGEPRFTSIVSSAYATGDPAGPAMPSLWPDLDPTGLTGPFGLSVRGPFRLPERIEEVMADASPTCRFRGPTVIRFDGGAARIRSPLSSEAGSSADATGDSPSLTRAFGCPGAPAVDFVEFTSVELPLEAVIEVEDAGLVCDVHPLGLEDSDDVDADWRCGAGDAFVWGNFSGVRAVVASGDIHLIWDLTRDTSAGSTLGSVSRMGLVAQESIILRRLVGVPLPVVAPLGMNLPFAGSDVPPFGSYPLDAPSDAPLLWSEPAIEASLAALNGSVRVQNPRIGQRAARPIRLTGSLAQRVRGPLGWDVLTTTGQLLARTGYALDLTYDQGLIDSAPPATPVFRDVDYRTIWRQEVPVPTHHSA